MSQRLDLLIAKALANNGVNVITNVPGFGGTQVYNHLSNIAPKCASICLNEEAAFSISVGAAVFGVRAAALVKTHGLAKMTNAICSALSVGTNAANLVFAFDDTSGKSSDNIFDAKGLIKGMEAPCVILQNDPESDILKAIQISEKLKLPVVIYIDCEKLGEEFPFSNASTRFEGGAFTKNPLQFVACPMLSKSQRGILLKKIASGTAPEEYEAPPGVSNVLESLPMHLKAVVQSYAPVFDAFANIDKDFVAGDAGAAALYAFDKHQNIDVCTYMGGAPGMALGAHLAGASKAWAFTGDFSFLAAGILGFNEIVARAAAVKVIVFNNHVAGTTGGQVVPQAVMDNFLKGHSHLIQLLDPKMPKETLVRIMEKMNASSSPQIGIVNFP